MTLLHATAGTGRLGFLAFDPVVTASLIAATAVYWSGVRRARVQARGRAGAIAPWRVRSFSVGMVVLAAALLPPLDAVADGLFSAHMAQHLLLAVVAPPFLVAGAPALAALWALPRTMRRRVTRMARTRGLVAGWRAVTTPIGAFSIHFAALWIWHLPSMYLAALGTPWLHALEHLSFLGTASLIWWGIIHPRRARRAAYGLGILVLFGTMGQSGALGALLTLSHRVWLPAQSAGAAVWGLSPMEDQQLAGLLMWVVGGLLFVGQMSVLFLLWLRSMERRRLVVGNAAVAAAAVALSVSGCARPPQKSVVPGGDVERGRRTLAALGCGSCHTIAGVPGARGLVGPPLTGIARRALIAGQLANTQDNMVRWIMDPPAFEPGTAMPNVHARESQARDMAAYLYTLH